MNKGNHMLDWINPSFPQAISINLILAAFIFVFGALLVTNLDRAQGAVKIFFALGFLTVIVVSLAIFLYNIYCIYLIISSGVDTGKDWALLAVYGIFLLSSLGSGVSMKQ